jgi:hypothetical protein
MKGPYERLKYDFYRIWECPVCHHRERTGGDCATLLCRCQKKLAPNEVVWMRLADDGPRRIDGRSVTGEPEHQQEPQPTTMLDAVPPSEPANAAPPQDEAPPLDSPTPPWTAESV